MKTLLVKILALLLTLGLAAGLVMVTLYQKQMATPVGIEKDAEFTVRSGDSLNRVLKRLEKDGTIDNRWAYKVLAALNPPLKQVKAGTYQITPTLTPPQLLALLVSGKEKQFSITLIEGEILRQWLDRLAAHPKLDWGELDPADPQFYSAVQAALQQRLQTEVVNFEGLLLPETYYFTAGSAGLDLLERAYRQMQTTLSDAWQQRQPELPLKSPYEALILASIIEKETGLASERPVIAAVFVNRLNKKMRLQTDPTIIYGLGAAFDGDITRAHKHQKTAYNTYRIDGLPPTPIAMPGAASLRAALMPADSDYLYFVARGDGSHQFSTNLSDHNKAVRRFQLGK